jgi:UDP-N-acetylglucosamine--N-acetylmuramyl-(pentapeptide) pyrophosphoryl-undecaprenol N-acetylglucosamine transferase
MALVNKDAAVLIKDSEAVEKLLPAACDLIENTDKIALLEKNIAVLARTDAAMTIAEETYRIIGK